MDGKELAALRVYLDRRFDNIDQRLTAIDERITVNAEERLAETEDLRNRFQNHLARNHRTPKVASGGIAAVIAAIVIGVFEGIRQVLSRG